MGPSCPRDPAVNVTAAPRLSRCDQAMPSRMSGSETSSWSHRRAPQDAVEDQRAGADARRRGPGACRAAPCARRRSSRAAAPTSVVHVVGGAARPGGSTVAVVGRQVEHAGRDGGHRAGHADHRGRGADRVDRAGVEVPRRCRATRPRPPSAVGGSACRCRSCSRTEPMSRECAAATAPARVAEDQLGRAAADVDDQHRRGHGSRRSRDARRRTTARPPRRRTSTSGSTPSRSRTPATKTSALVGVARRRGRAEADPAAHVVRGDDARRTPRPRAKVRASASSASRPVRSTPWPSRTIRDLAHRRPRRARSADQQLDRVGAAVDGGDAGHSTGRVGADARAGGPPVAERVEHLVAERVDAAALGERLAGQHVQALDPVGHPAGRDAGDLGDARPIAARAAGEVGARAPRRTPPPARGRRRAGPAISLHQPRRPRACRSGRRPAGRSGRRSSGTACRRAAAARWRRRRGCRTGSGARSRGSRAAAGRAGAATAADVARRSTLGGSLASTPGSMPASPGGGAGRLRRVAGQLDRAPRRRSTTRSAPSRSTVAGSVSVVAAARAACRPRRAPGSDVSPGHHLAEPLRGPAPRRRPGRRQRALLALERGRCRLRAARSGPCRSLMCARCWR